MKRALATFRSVDLGYGNRVIVSGLDFQVWEGDFLGIVGPNGAGKTTILRGLLGLLPPRAGEVRMAESDGNGLHLGYVPQRDSLDEIYPVTVLDVVLMGRYRRMGRFRLPGARDREEARRALEQAGIRDLAERPFRNLSGGQKQRTLIARALAARPQILVLDEPTNGLDLAAENSIMTLLHRLHRETGVTVVMVSHLLNTVARWVKRIGILHEGHLEIGELDEILTPSTLTRVYGAGSDVERVRGRLVVLPPEEKA